jgi:magnesium chelatase family protein
MLARWLTTLLPAMPLAEALETTRIHSVAGLTGRRTAAVTTRPCRAPHHTLADGGLIGGDQVPMPGELSGDHRGVHFLDGTPGVHAARPGSAATAAEKGRVIIGRTSLFLTLPFYHSLIGTMNYRPEG